jgi:hypothetical protein
MLLRSVNDSVDMGPENLPSLRASVVYHGDTQEAALIVGQAEFQWNNPNNSDPITMAVGVRRAGRHPLTTAINQVQVPVEGRARLTFPLVTDLVDGDVIDCFAGCPGGFGATFQANGFLVLIL